MILLNVSERTARGRCVFTVDHTEVRTFSYAVYFKVINYDHTLHHSRTSSALNSEEKN